MVKVIVKWADRIAAVAGIAALVLGWVPILGQFLAAVALIAALVSLLGNLSLVGTGYGSWDKVLWSAVGVAAFGLGKVAMGAFKVSAAGVRGAARSHVSLPMRELLGPKPMGYFAGKSAANRSLQQGFISKAEAWQTLKGIPRSTLNDVINIRNFRPSHVGEGAHHLQQAGGHLQFMRQHEAAEHVRDISRIAQPVRASESVALHAQPLRAQEAVFAGTYGFASYRLVDQTVPSTLGPSPAEQLNLPGQPELAGARP